LIGRRQAIARESVDMSGGTQHRLVSSHCPAVKARRDPAGKTGELF